MSMNIIKKQFKTLATFVVTAALAAAFVALSGCASEGMADTSQVHDTVLVLGNHRNAVALSSDSYPDAWEGAKESVAKSLMTGGEIKVVKVDGAPALVSGFAEEAQEDYAKYKNKEDETFLMQQATRIADDFVENVIEASKATVAEVDTLAALKIAGDECSKLPATDEVEVLVVDSGLATTSRSVLDFTRDDISSIDTAMLVERIDQDGALPDFACADSISWYGLGATADPQDDLSYQQVDRLREVYVACIQAAGYEGDAEACFVSKSPASADVANAGDLPDVTEVVYAVTISNDKVSFVPDQAVFIDPEAAAAELAEVADELNSHSATRVKIVGCTAHYGSEEACKDLGYRRAIAVRDELVNTYGVAESQVPLESVVGAGYSSSYSTYDADGDGIYSDAEAQADRKIVIESI